MKSAFRRTLDAVLVSRSQMEATGSSKVADKLRSKVANVKSALAGLRGRSSVSPLTTSFEKSRLLARSGGDRMRHALGFRRITPAECAASCDELLRCTVRTPFSTYLRNGLYTVELASPAHNPNAPVLVLTHGYATGSGLWCVVFDRVLADIFNNDVKFLSFSPAFTYGSVNRCYALDKLAPYFKVYAVDWLGCGASERPPWNAGTTAAAEAFFLDAFEA
jgi:hypothetical protein